MIFCDHSVERDYCVDRSLLIAALNLFKAQLFKDVEEGFRAMGPEIHGIFATFSTAQIEAALGESYMMKSLAVNLVSTKKSKPEVIADSFKQRQLEEAATDEVAN